MKTIEYMVRVIVMAYIVQARNLALERPVTSSHLSAVGYSLDNAVDGKYNFNNNENLFRNFFG